MKNFSRLLPVLLLFFFYMENHQVVCMEPQNRERISVTKCEEYKDLVVKTTQMCTMLLNRSCFETTALTCSGVKGLVIGGVNASLEDFPHMASIGYETLDQYGSGVITFNCGGSLISEKHVLTAAHCYNSEFQENGVVRLGVVDKNDETGLDFGIAQFTVHEDYNRRTKQNDIAMIELSRKVWLDKRKTRPDSANLKIRPACLWQDDDIEQNSTIAAGWGDTEYGSFKSSNILMKVRLDIFDIDRCSYLKDNDDRLVIDDDQLCVGFEAGGKDTCSGDSGGPTQVFKSDNKCAAYIIGVTSYGSTFCGAKSSPAIYARVSRHLDWIEKQVWGGHY